MSYKAVVTVAIGDRDGETTLDTTEVVVEFDAPDDPRALLARVALEQAADDARLAERVLWQ